MLMTQNKNVNVYFPNDRNDSCGEAVVFKDPLAYLRVRLHGFHSTMC